MALSQRQYSRSEVVADRTLHAFGLAAATLGVTALLVLTARTGAARTLAAIGVYGAGLLTMLTASAVANYHLSHQAPPWIERLDHAAIFFMIAGTYTPFAVIVLPRTWGLGLMLFVWGVGGVGSVLKLMGRLGYTASIGLYLTAGWSILPAVGHLMASMPTTAVTFLIAGGVLYSVGVAAFTAEQLPFHTAIWHATVLLAAGCHYTAVLTGVVLPHPGA